MGKRRRRSQAGESATGERPSKRRSSEAVDLLQATDADYVISGGLRYVLPYVYKFSMTCKDRWRGRALLEIFSAEFTKHAPDYWSREFKSGRITVGGDRVSPRRIWGAQDVVVHTIHRHESPVYATEIVIVHEDEDFLVVDKPASIPIHPCGTYRKNSLIYLLAARGRKGLRIVHRLDKQTSGIVVFAKHRQAAASFCEDISSRSVQKRYLACVQGRFPENIVTRCNMPLAVDESSNSSFVDCLGKEAETLFFAAGYDTDRDQSMVVAEPLTGRSHQIRVHLQHMGHPIVNDPLYNKNYQGASASSADGNSGYARAARLKLNDLDLNDRGSIDREGTSLGCDTCPRLANSINIDRDEDMQIYLHALTYEADTWKYATRIPKWARDFAGQDIESVLKLTPTLRGLQSVTITAEEKLRAVPPRASLSSARCTLV